MDDGMTGFCIRPRGGGGGGGNKCGRWNPTAEQVKVLTELFRSGLRTPSTDQIQKISSQLSFYGKIESKNVFYWFQNHKARERQKRRRVSLPSEHHHQQYDIHSDHGNRLSSTKRFAEANQSVLEPERVIETLQLFPLNSFHESKSSHGKLRLLANEYNGSTASFTYNHGATVDDCAPLDLRLSFI